MKAGLNNTRILVTRPHPWAAELADEITRAGGTPISIPTIIIEPVTGNAFAASTAILSDISQYQIAVFVSRSAAQFAIKRIAAMKLHWPLSVKSYAVGATTAQMLNEAHIPTTPPLCGEGADALLQHPALQDPCPGQGVVFKGAHPGRSLTDELAQRGLQMTNCILYRTICPQQHAHSLKHALEHIDIITVTSVEILNNLVHLAAQSADKMKNYMLCVTSPRILNAAREQGFCDIVLAKDSSNRAITHTIIRAYDERHNK